MITFYRKINCPFCDEIEETFREIVIAFKFGNTFELPKNQSKILPLIVDGNKQISGKEPIQNYIQELKKEMAGWQKFQNDSCYLDDDGKVC